MSLFLEKVNFKPNRVGDFMYDPVFTVPTEKDYRKHVHAAKVQSAQVDISPIFEHMFSDNPRYKPTQTVIRQPNYNVTWQKPQEKALTATGYINVPNSTPALDKKKVDLVMFLKSPIIKISTDENFNKELLSYSTIRNVALENKCVQTIYRESSAQTRPWKPANYVISNGSDPEILKLDFLRNSLPVGMHEIELIKRARKKRDWEKLLPEGMDDESKIKRYQIIQAIETDQWAFREQEIQDIQDLRMTLLENMLQEILNETASRSKTKLDRMAERLQKEKEEKLKKIKKQKVRELRRLEKEYKGFTSKYHKVGIIEEYAEYSSEIFAPLLRHGVDPKRGHEKIDEKTYQPALLEIEHMSTLPGWLAHFSKSKNEVKSKGRTLCIRETKWTEPVLKQLHEDLTNLRNQIKSKCNLRKRIIRYVEYHETLNVQPEEDPYEKQNDAILFIQSIIRGRAIQSMIYEGRDRCRELIQELQHTFPLQETNKLQIHQERIKVMNQQRTVQIETIRKENMNEILCKLEGTVVGTLLDFLNKEYRRLLDERKAHAMALMHERDRQEKEAAEAGRRQLEERRRQEHDEVFKQVMKVHQDTVDLYLQDIIMEGITEVSETEASVYVKKLAEKINEEVKETTNMKYTEKEELIADMLHHFIVPEIERTFDRQKLRQRQQKHLTNAFKCIFNKLDSLYDEEAEEEEEEEDFTPLNPSDGPCDCLCSQESFSSNDTT